jgi:hypothetical protein
MHIYTVNVLKMNELLQLSLMRMGAGAWARHETILHSRGVYSFIRSIHLHREFRVVERLAA